jgi:hypothetical protein
MPSKARKKDPKLPPPNTRTQHQLLVHQILRKVTTPTMSDFFSAIPKIEYKGPDSDDLLSYRYYNAEEEIHGKKMKDWLRFSVCMWHTFRGNGGDPFGPTGTITRGWDDGTDSLENALRRVRVAFEFFVKLGVQYYTFHDVDVSPEGKTIQVCPCHTHIRLLFGPESASRLKHQQLS